MATVKSILADLKRHGNEQTRSTYVRHGMPKARMYGVKVADMKLVAKKIKGEHPLACELYQSGILEAMYLAGMVVDPKQLSKKELEDWIDAAEGLGMIAEYTVPGVATDSCHAAELARKWIKSKKEHVAACGWNTYSGIVATTADEDLDTGELKQLMGKVVSEIDKAQNRVRYSMNSFVISVGTYVKPLADEAMAAAKKIGVVTVEMGDTACNVPLATTYIRKAIAAGKHGKKRKSIRC